jgi:hypothetical protein
MITWSKSVLETNTEQIKTNYLLQMLKLAEDLVMLKLERNIQFCKPKLTNEKKHV